MEFSKLHFLLFCLSFTSILAAATPPFSNVTLATTTSSSSIVPSSTNPISTNNLVQSCGTTTVTVSLPCNAQSDPLTVTYTDRQVLTIHVTKTITATVLPTISTVTAVTTVTTNTPITNVAPVTVTQTISISTQVISTVESLETTTLPARTLTTIQTSTVSVTTTLIQITSDLITDLTISTATTTLLTTTTTTTTPLTTSLATEYNCPCLTFSQAIPGPWLYLIGGFSGNVLTSDTTSTITDLCSCCQVCTSANLCVAFGISEGQCTTWSESDAQSCPETAGYLPPLGGGNSEVVYTGGCAAGFGWVAGN